MRKENKIAVVIPSYKVCTHILSVIENIGPEVNKIYVIDDCCPDDSGDFVENKCSDARVTVIRNLENQGVGGAVMTGYKAAIDDGMDIIVKVDGDGQMDPRLIPYFIEPIESGKADYTKGNRFFDLDGIYTMPRIRIFGNAVLSFMSKLSSGYWNLFDPTNGYTAIHRNVILHLPLNKISRCYFFETDILFRLNILGAVVLDIPMEAKYSDELSNLHIYRVLGGFPFKHARNFLKRIFYSYFLRDMSLASIELLVGTVMLFFGVIFGGRHWYASWQSLIPASAGIVMFSAMPILVGIQLILSFLAYDIASVPRSPFHHFAEKIVK